MSKIEQMLTTLFGGAQTGRVRSDAGAGAVGRDPVAAARANGVPVLGIDVGSTNIKVVLVRLDPAEGTVTEAAVRSAPTPPDADGLVRTVLDLVRSLPAGPPPQAVGIASMAETGVALDRDGRPLTELLRWDGHRGEEDAARLAAEHGRDELFAATGVRPSAKVPLATWHRLRRTQPDLWRRVARWAGAADVVALAMTGRLVTDHTLAGRTMAYRLPVPGEPLPGEFDEGLLAAVDLRPEQLPAVARPGDAAGVVVDGDVAAAGIPAGTPVVVAGHDHAVGTWAAGVRAPGDHADSIGTAEAVLTVLAGPVDRAAVARQGMSLVRTVEGAHEALLAGAPAAGAMVAWWLRTVLPGRTVEAALAGRVPDGPTGVLVLPYPTGRQSPRPDPSARVRVVDDRGLDVTEAALTPIPVDGDPARVATLTLAVLEGLALQARWMLDTQRLLAAGAAGARPPHALRVLGGAAAGNEVWMALKAAVTPAPVRLVAAAEPVATGAAMLAAERVGLVPAGVLRLPARPAAPGTRPGADGRYDDALERFVAAATGAPVPPAAPPHDTSPAGPPHDTSPAAAPHDTSPAAPPRAPLDAPPTARSGAR